MVLSNIDPTHERSARQAVAVLDRAFRRHAKSDVLFNPCGVATRTQQHHVIPKAFSSLERPEIGREKFCRLPLVDAKMYERAFAP